MATITNLADGWRHEITTTLRCVRKYWVEGTTASDLKGALPARGSTPSYTDWPAGYKVEDATLEGVGNGDSSPYIAEMTVIGTTGPVVVTKVNDLVKSNGYAQIIIRPKDLGLRRALKSELGKVRKADSSPLRDARRGEWIYLDAEENYPADGNVDVYKTPFTNANTDSESLESAVDSDNADEQYTVLEATLSIGKSKTNLLDAADFVDKRVFGWGDEDIYFPDIEADPVLSADGTWKVIGFSTSEATDVDGTEILIYTLQFRSVPAGLGTLYWNPRKWGGTVDLATALADGSGSGS